MSYYFYRIDPKCPSHDVKYLVPKKDASEKMRKLSRHPAYPRLASALVDPEP